MKLAAKGLQPVVVGSASELSLGEEVLAGCDIGHNLAGQTNLEDLFLLARDAYSAVGNDTGPMHIFATQGAEPLFFILVPRILRCVPSGVTP